LGAKEAPLGVPTVWARQSGGVEMALQPQNADALAQQFADREINHVAIVPYLARWLHMSQIFMRVV
jgi:hypothetical protein